MTAQPAERTTPYVSRAMDAVTSYLELAKREGQPATTELATEDHMTLRRVTSNLPYGAAYPAPVQFNDVAHLALWLAGFAGVLERQAAKAEATERELAKLRADVAAARRVFGTA